ncbi:MAG: hypothetical protein CMG69_04795 [Candidatus Marinimicrobia bacterium]|nr:hypothetical protein [Candidatus Neomarinimicrobiota bacterium]|tara:strand:- start:12703 stop:13224 length:522 start_codon:yes stop_codon:yes gene_type:complete
MSDRSNTVWVIVCILAFISILFAGLKLYPVRDKWENAVKRAQNTKIGTDVELENVIGFLEDRLRYRLDYEFSLEKEPMRLTNVVYLTDGSGKRISGKRTSKVKVAHVINGKIKYAGILYKGQHFNVTEGDSVAGGRVKQIGKLGIIIEKDGQEKFYEVETNSHDGQQNKLGEK